MLIFYMYLQSVFDVQEMSLLVWDIKMNYVPKYNLNNTYNGAVYISSLSPFFIPL